ncbi:amino acid transporter [Caldanaerobacter subterraneus subsp. pacificus DSM 12653]|uniref:Amino acid transporter n=1 Tax=Caldanaerobacter subterraneus subsp. pacificus DSM 12653 TaxID=391606 RepID=B7R8J9_9THEO|nr:amino acid transporter [Caldanaerobacter subterraneus subsp. pacificus DSM 12653]
MIASTVAVGWGGYFNSFLETVFGITLPQAISHDITHGGIVNLPAILGLLIVAWIALTGIRASGIANALFTTAKVFAILFVLTVGVFHIKLENWTTPFAPYGIAGIMTGAALTFFAYTGFDGITSLLEEVKRPERDIPIALIGGISLCALFYVAMSAVITGMVHWTKLDVPNPAAFVLMQVGIPWGEALISISVLFGLIATMLGNSLSASRILFAMGRDGLLPEWFAFVHPTRRVPRNAAYVIYTAAIIFAGFLSISELAELANIGGLTAFTLVTISVMVMRYTDPERKRIFKVPAILGYWAYWNNRFSCVNCKPSCCDVYKIHCVACNRPYHILQLWIQAFQGRYRILYWERESKVKAKGSPTKRASLFSI